MTNKSELAEKIKGILKKVSKDKLLGDAFKSNMKVYNVPPSISISLMEEQNVFALDSQTLYWTVVSLLKLENKIQIPSMDLNRYFTPEEMEQYKAASMKTKPANSEYPLIIEGCQQIMDDMWQTVLDMKTIERWLKADVINYNPNTQRGMSYKTMSNGEVRTTISMNSRSVENIANLAKNWLFIPNTITLNLNADNIELDYEYNFTEERIIITNGQLDIIDGYHRIRGLLTALAQKPECNYKMSVRITNFTTEKAGRFIWQEDLRNKINKTHIESLNSQNFVTLVVKRLNEDMDSDLQGMIGNYDEPILRSLLFGWIDQFFKVDTRADVIKVTKILKDVFNTLLQECIVTVHQLDYYTLGIIVAASASYGMLEAVEKCKVSLKNVRETRKKRITAKDKQEIIRMLEKAGEPYV